MRLWGLLFSLCLVAFACAGQSDPASGDASVARELSESTSSDESSEDAASASSDESAAPGNNDAQGTIESDTNAEDGSDDSSTDSASTINSDAEQAPDASVGSSDEDEAADETVDTESASNDEGAADDDNAAAGDTATSAPAPATEFDRVVDELIAFVEQERGYSFTSRPEIDLLTNDQFGQAWLDVVADDVSENQAEYVNYTDIYRAMGVIDGDRSLEEIWQRFGDAGVIGFYNPSTGGIVLRNGEVNAFTRSVLVHELVHALEDQVFDIDRPQYANEANEREWTFSALIEGSARRIETIYRSTFTAAELEEETAARRALPRTVSLSEFNTSFLELQFGRYRYGEEFVTTLWNQGADSLDDALAQPPLTSEAILDPDFYLRSDETQELALPPADGEVFESGVWGEAAWAAVFADIAAVAEAETIADGWNGDSFVAYRNGSTTCVRVHLAADTPTELDEYAETLEAWASLELGRDVFFPSADLIRVTACG